MFEDRIECQPCIPASEQDRKVDPASATMLDACSRFTAEDLQWLNDTNLWDGLKKQAASVMPQHGRELCVVDASTLALPAALPVVARSLPQDMRPPATFVGSCREPTAAKAFLAANGFTKQVHLHQRSTTSSFVELLEEPTLAGEACEYILIVADAVQRSGELRQDVLAQVAAAHRHCEALGRSLTVLPGNLILSLTLLESLPLARSSRVQWTPNDDLCVDVRSLNVLAPSTFEALSEAKLSAKRLTCEHEVRLLLSSSSFLTQLPSLEVGQKHRLGPVLTEGTLHGVLCEWSWSGNRGDELRNFDKAGVVWPEALPSRVEKGDYVLVEIRLLAARGMLVTPLEVQRAGSALPSG
ncbi:prmt9, partial [Symbiodinium pilosum]